MGARIKWTHLAVALSGRGHFSSLSEKVSTNKRTCLVKCEKGLVIHLNEAFSIESHTEQVERPEARRFVCCVCGADIEHSPCSQLADSCKNKTADKLNFI